MDKVKKVNSVKIDLQKYHTAIMLVKKAAEKKEGIKKTNFIETHKLSPLFFRTMEDLKIIKEISFSMKDGALYSWEYRAAANELDSKVSTIITEKLQHLNRKNYERYSTPEYLAKKLALKKKREAEAKLNPPVVFNKLKPNTQHTATHGGKTITAQSKTMQFPVHHEVPKIEETVVVENLQQATKHKANYKNATFAFSGSLDKKDLLSKIEILIADQPIGSFSIEVTY